MIAYIFTNNDDLITTIRIEPCVTVLNQQSISVDIDCVINLLEQSGLPINNSFMMSIGIHHATSILLKMDYETVKVEKHRSPESGNTRIVYGGSDNKESVHNLLRRLSNMQHYSSPNEQRKHAVLLNLVE